MRHGARRGCRAHLLGSSPVRRLAMAGWVMLELGLGSACGGKIMEGTGVGGVPSRPGETPGSGPGSAPDAGGGPSQAGLPCDVAALLTSTCTSCHSNPPVGGAPVALVGRDALLAPNPKNSAETLAQASVRRMRDTISPMPPSPTPPVAAPDLVAFEAWVQAGSPAGSCAPGDAGVSPYDTPTQCSSNTHWTGGNSGSDRMHPGGTCVACHASSADAPHYLVAGTVFPTAHEPTDCEGVSSGVTVEITDAAGGVHTLAVNPAGNFFAQATWTLPYRARVLANGRSRAMSAAQNNGDCNLCHTEAGANGAPGRIMAP